MSHTTTLYDKDGREIGVLLHNYAAVLRQRSRSLTAGWPSLEKAVAVASLEDALNCGSLRRATR